MRITDAEFNRGWAAYNDERFDLSWGCHFCDLPPKAYWHAKGRYFGICERCAETILPPLFADAVFVSHQHPDVPSGVLERFISSFWRAVAWRFSRDLRGQNTPAADAVPWVELPDTPPSTAGMRI